MTAFRIERDSLGEVRVPANALWGAQTQRAIENFPISGIVFPRSFLRALGLVKTATARANGRLGLLQPDIAKAIEQAALEVAGGKHDDQFPLDIFQTGSGTSTNMNANEVIAHRASEIRGKSVHPNDHVNMSQSSNDVIPTSMYVAACLEVREQLLPAMSTLSGTLRQRAEELKDVVKTGRTHLMDAMPVTFGQAISGWQAQVDWARERVEGTLPRLHSLTIGGTAVGTGINAHPDFAAMVVEELGELTGVPFRPVSNRFAAQASVDTAVELSGALKTFAVALMKIANDLRWMNSGPRAGLGEIVLPALQPGSSIMPGKVNPVIPEAVAMVAAQVMGNDVTITIGGQSGNFELNVMLPVVAHALLQSIQLLANGSRVLADKAVRGFQVNRSHVAELLARNPILVTSLNPIIGYDKAADIALKAYHEGRRIKDVALEMTDLSEADLDRLLDPRTLTLGGIQGSRRPQSAGAAPVVPKDSPTRQ